VPGPVPGTHVLYTAAIKDVVAGINPATGNLELL